MEYVAKYLFRNFHKYLKTNVAFGIRRKLQIRISVQIWNSSFNVDQCKLLARLVSSTDAVLSSIVNLLILNKQKTEYTVFFLKHRLDTVLPNDIYSRDTIMKIVRETKFLDFTLAINYPGLVAQIMFQVICLS